jgi:hypothetical protein
MFTYVRKSTRWKNGRSLLDEECRRVGSCLFHMTHFLSFANIVLWRVHGKIQRYAALAIPALYCTHRLKMEVISKFIWAPCHVMRTAVLIATLLPPSPRIWTRFTRALLVRKDRRHLSVTPWLYAPLWFLFDFLQAVLENLRSEATYWIKVRYMFSSFVCNVFVYIGAMLLLQITSDRHFINCDFYLTLSYTLFHTKRIKKQFVLFYYIFTVEILLSVIHYFIL